MESMAAVPEAAGFFRTATPLTRLVQVAEEGGDPLAAADAHGDDAPLRLAALELICQLDGQDGAGGAHRVAERDGAAIWIDLLGIDLQLADHGDRLRGESLIQFP